MLIKYIRFCPMSAVSIIIEITGATLLDFLGLFVCKFSNFSRSVLSRWIEKSVNHAEFLRIGLVQSVVITRTHEQLANLLFAQNAENLFEYPSRQQRREFASSIWKIKSDTYKAATEREWDTHRDILRTSNYMRLSSVGFQNGKCKKQNNRPIYFHRCS